MAVLAIALTSLNGAATVVEAVDVASVWSGHPVGFCLLTHPPHQYIAYYDDQRRLTVASRRLDGGEWLYTVLPEEIGWDSHNYVTMAIDDEGLLHLAGNMHVSPLKYFRSAAPFDAASLTRVPSMIGSEEQRVTYPEFLRGVEGELIFTYRDGSSGSGNQIYNVYEPRARTWKRLLDTPLVDGEGAANAYFHGPLRGPDGYFHLCWIWRDTPDCATNHDLCYAKSKDLVHWETSGGAPYRLPITQATAEVVDPVPPGGGLLNGNAKIGFDPYGRPVIAYHKFDENGKTQLYNARLENGTWKRYPSSRWNYRWEFSGNGAIESEIRIQPIEIGSDGTITQTWWHIQYGSERWRLDPLSLAPADKLDPPPPKIPSSLRKVESAFAGMGVRFREDSGTAGAAGVRYLLRWETLGPNRDRPREKPWPQPSTLRVYRIRE